MQRHYRGKGNGRPDDRHHSGSRRRAATWRRRDKYRAWRHKAGGHLHKLYGLETNAETHAKQCTIAECAGREKPKFVQQIVDNTLVGRRYHHRPKPAENPAEAAGRTRRHRRGVQD